MAWHLEKCFCVAGEVEQRARWSVVESVRGEVVVSSFLLEKKLHFYRPCVPKNVLCEITDLNVAFAKIPIKTFAACILYHSSAFSIFLFYFS